MKRRRLYIFLALLILGSAALQKLDYFSVLGVEKGSVSGEYPAAWENMIISNINGKTIQLFVDGKEWNVSDGSIYMTQNRELMLPVSILTKAFSCAVNYYDNSRLVIQSHSLKVEMWLNENTMKVNDLPMSLDAALTEYQGSLYLPLSVIQKGLSYTVEWNVEEGVIKILSSAKDTRKLPYAYDYREEGRSPIVKNQGTLGTCWAFASLMAVETALLPEEQLDFSEDHMSIKNSFQLTQNAGGEYTMSMAYLLAWQGPVLEEEDPYGDEYSPEGLNPRKHVQEIQILPSKDYEKIKEAVYLYGGVQSSLYTSLINQNSRSVYYNKSENAYCYIGTEKPNHDVVIVGWDDNYPRENFNMDLEGDGAFLCINSWGNEFGDDGYFYVSYYDTNIGIHNILYTSIEDTNNYDHIYQSDLCGWVGQLGYGQDTAYFANIYEAGENEALKGVGFYATGPETEYEVYLAQEVTDSGDFERRELIAQGKFLNSGYYTVPLEEEIVLKDNKKFAVIVKITTPGTIHPVAIEYDAENSKTKVDLSDGEGYISLRGTAWEQVETEQSCNVCLKAYTVDQ